LLSQLYAHRKGEVLVGHGVNRAEPIGKTAADTASAVLVGRK